MQVAQALLAGDEYRLALVRSAYGKYLRRPAAPAELTFGLSFLQAGATHEQLQAYVLGSAEYLATQGRARSRAS